MHRGPSSHAGRSKAAPSTTCQKCLKKGHYSYECKVTTQERPYLARPSRTQQLFNPKLMPQLTSDVPNDLLRRKGVVDEVLAKQSEERGRKHARDDDHSALPPRTRSRSESSFSSVSTVSTNRSPTRSPFPHQRRTNPSGHRAHSPPSDARKRRRRSVSSSPDRNASDRPKERNTRRRRSSYSPAQRGRRRSRSFLSNNRDRSASATREQSVDHEMDRSPSPYSRRKRTSRRSPARSPPGRAPRMRSPPRYPNRDFDRDMDGVAERPSQFSSAPRGSPPASTRERSLSPYSKRLALTQTMNVGH
ncbi:zinc knuckle-domain-containing protein [Phyllosticta citrichinensis]